MGRCPPPLRMLATVCVALALAAPGLADAQAPATPPSTSAPAEQSSASREVPATETANPASPVESGDAPARTDAASKVANGDAGIGQRLDARLGAITALKDVRATVAGGIVVLEGETVTGDQRRLAEVIASQMQGVEKVENRIVLSSRLRDRFEVALRTANDKLLRMIAAAPLLVVAILIVFFAVRLGRLVTHRPRWLPQLKTSNPYTEGLVQRLLQWVIVLAGVLLALDLLGATSLVGALLGSAGVFGLAIGFAFRDIAENYVAGILLSLRRPFSPGDHLLIDRVHEGKVVALTSRATLLMTLDGNHLSLPNALVFKSVVLNYSQNPLRRFDFLVPLDPSASVGDTKRAGLSALERVDGVLADPAPQAMLQEVLHDRQNVQFQGWVDQTRNSLQRVRSEAMRATKGAIDRAGIRRAGTPERTEEHPETPAVAAERMRGPGPDTSVDRDIEPQMARARQAAEDVNLLAQKENAGAAAPSSPPTKS